jgi:hypothetical protein
MASNPPFEDTGSQNHFTQLALKTWDEISGRVNSMVMTALFKRLILVVDSLKTQQI